MSSVAPSSGDSGIEEWLELESDPGVFSLLIEDYGVRGVKVEEVYDISQKFDSTVFGFVFLFRYELTDRRARKKARDMNELTSYVLDDKVISGMFFAHQIITNSCATHALLSVLLNCHNLDIGPNLTRLKDFTQGLDPESKGFAIANMMELAHIHNKHARPPRTLAPPTSGRKSSIVSSAFALLPETYHYVSFVPINGRLFELDGLKEFPIDHGPWGEEEKWTDLFQRTVTQRLQESQDCLFNLMALIPDPVPQISEHLKKLQDEQTSLLNATAELAQQVRAMKEQKESVSTGVGVDPKEASLCKPGEGLADAGEDTSSTVASTGQTTIADSAEPSSEEVKPTGQVDSNRTVKDATVTGPGPGVDADPEMDTNTVRDGDAEKSIKEEPSEENSTALSSEKKEPTAVTSIKEELMEVSKPVEACDPIASLLNEISRTLPTEADELVSIASTPVDSTVSLDKRLRVTVAKVVRNHKETEEFKQKLKEEVEIKQRFRIEHSRRIHDYDAFIFDFVKCLAQNKQLPDRLLRRPAIAPPLKGGGGGQRKRKNIRVSRKPKTTLLLNGSEVR